MHKQASLNVCIRFCMCFIFNLYKIVDQFFKIQYLYLSQLLVCGIFEIFETKIDLFTIYTIYTKMRVCACAIQHFICRS